MTQDNPFGLALELNWIYRTACDRWVPMRQLVALHHNVDCPDCWRAARKESS